jgi:mRNA-degrading endonuclease RelE of RelBE toxin-antitoxin system
MPFRVDLSSEARSNVRSLTAFQQRAVRDAIQQQLLHQADVRMRNRFPMRPNDSATWELRIGDLRVYYDIDGDQVTIVAVGVKEGNRVLVEGREFSFDG